MASYTFYDMVNAKLYANERMKLLKLTKLFDKRPNLCTKIDYKIIQADSVEDYYFPEEFKKRAIKVILTVNKSLCDTISCFPFKSDGNKCTSTDTALFYRVGDTDTFDVSCAPACFNMQTTQNEVPSDKSQNITTKFINNRCVFTNMLLQRNMEMPIYRSDVRYIQNVNDFPVGFDRVTNSDGTTTYRTNKPYCDAMEDEYDSVKKTCVASKFDRFFLYPVFGDSIIRYIKKSADKLIDTVSKPKPDPYPSPPPVPSEYLVSNWLADIDSSFVLPSPDVDVPDGVYTLEEIEYLTLKNERGHSMISKYNKLPLKGIQSDGLKDDGKITDIGSFIKKEIDKILNGDGELGLLPSATLQISVDVLISQLKKILTEMSVEFFKTVTESMIDSAEMFGGIFSETLSSSIQVMLSTVFEEFLPAEFMASVTASLAELLSGIGTVVIVFQIFSIILTLWDPWNLREKYSNESMDKMAACGDSSLKHYLGIKDLTVTVEYILRITLNKDDVVSLLGAHTKYVYEYLNSLKVNSEGSTLYRGYQMDNKLRPTQSDYNAFLAQTHIYTPSQIVDFEQSHETRLKSFRTTKLSSMILITVGFVMLYLNYVLISIILFLAGCVMLCLNYVNIYTEVSSMFKM